MIDESRAIKKIVSTKEEVHAATCQTAGIRFFVCTSIELELNQAQQPHVKSGILMDKTINDKSLYLQNDIRQNYPFCRMKLMVKNLSTFLSQ